MVLVSMSVSLKKATKKTNIRHNNRTMNEQEKTKTEVKEENVEPEDYVLTPELIYSGQIDPMIGMEDIKLEEKR